VVTAADPGTGDLSGAVLVTRRGATVTKLAGGIADRATGEACTPRTRFQIASISKRFTAAAVLMLVEEGTVALEDRLDRLLPDCPEHWRPITVHQLLTHTSGITHWNGIAGYDLCRPQEPAEQLAIYRRQPMYGPPGGHWHYSSPGYQLLAWVAERVSGQSHAALVRERILSPLGLASTTVGEPTAGAEAVAHGHRGGVEVPVWNLDANTGTGDVVSTVSDLARFTAALGGDSLLSSGTRTVILTPHAAIDADRTRGGPWTVEGYGYGCFVGTLWGRRAHFHPGDNPGFVGFAAHLPEDGTTVAVLTNDDHTNLGALLDRLHLERGP
jgi:CubicO group peptidase (beta-lactamase class C family)